VSRADQDPVRRVVTGVDERGKSTVVSDGSCQCRAVQEQYVSEDLWLTTLPAPVDGEVDVPAVADLDPERGQLVWRRFALGPGETIGLHATETVDLMTVDSGKVTLVLETGNVVLSRGDCVVQRGTRHGWVNEGPDACVLIGIMASTL
jgi:quercetin dioxygenase-like cupin family protein